MKVLGKLFSRKKKLVNSPELKVCIIDDTTTNLWVTFGITEERKKELIDMCATVLKKSDSKSEAYVEIVDNCKHVNEVITSTIIFERMCEGPGDEHPLAGLLRKLGQ